MTELAKADQKVNRRVMPRDEAVQFFTQPGRALQGRDHRQHPGRRRRSASTGRATGWTCAAARTCPPPASSRRSSSRRWPAPTGAATRATRCCSGSTARPGPTRSSSRSTCTAWRRPRSAIIAASARSSICSTCRKRRPGAVFWHPKGWTVFQTLIGYMRERQNAAGYQEVNAPELMDAALCGSSPGTWRSSARTCISPRRRMSASTPSSP